MDLPAIETDTNDQTPISETSDVIADACSVLQSRSSEPLTRLDAIGVFRNALQSGIERCEQTSTSAPEHDFPVTQSVTRVTRAQVMVLTKIAVNNFTIVPEEMAAALEVLRRISALTDNQTQVCFTAEQKSTRGGAKSAYMSMLNAVVKAINEEVMFAGNGEIEREGLERSTRALDVLGYLARDSPKGILLTQLLPQFSGQPGVSRSILGDILGYLKNAAAAAGERNEGESERFLVAWAAAVECACHVVGAFEKNDKETFDFVFGAFDLACNRDSLNGTNALESILSRGGASRILACASPELLSEYGAELAEAAKVEKTPWIREALVSALRKVPVVKMTNCVTVLDTADPKPKRTNPKLEPKEPVQVVEPPVAIDIGPSDGPFISNPGHQNPAASSLNPFQQADLRSSPKTELDVVSALLTDPCLVIRVAATETLKQHGKFARQILSRLFPNLRSNDAALREATLQALNAAWREDDVFVASVIDSTLGPNDVNTECVVPQAAKEPVELPNADGDTNTHSVNPIPAALPPKQGTSAAEKKAMALTAAAACDLLRDFDGGVREAACELFGTLKEAATVGEYIVTLQELMEKDSEEAVRDAAITTLTKLGYYNPLTGRQQKKGFFGRVRARAFGDASGKKPSSSLSRRTACEVGSTIRVWWPDDECFYEARIRAWDRETDIHTLLYITDGVEEDLDLKKEKCELRYKPHKRGAKEAWLPINKPTKKPKIEKPPSEKKVKLAKPPKPVKPVKPKVLVEPVIKHQVLPTGTQIRIFWPLDKAWYGGEVKGYCDKKMTHVVLYHDGVEESLDFNKEQVTTVSIQSGGKCDGSPSEITAIPPLKGNPPVRIPITCGSKGIGWVMPNARRGKETVAYVDDANINKTVTAVEFAFLFDDDKDDKAVAEPDTSIDKLREFPVKSTSISLQSQVEQRKRWRRGCRFDPTRASEFWKKKGGSKNVSIGTFLSQMGGAWGEFVVGRPVTVRRGDYSYSENEILEVERRLEGVGGDELSGGASDGKMGDGTAEVEGEDDGRNVDLTREQPPQAPPSQPNPIQSDSKFSEQGLGSSDDEEGVEGNKDDEGYSQSDSDNDSTKSKKWMTGSIVKYSDSAGEHQVLFPDGTREWITLVLNETC